jgi:hypothetical protein
MKYFMLVLLGLLFSNVVNASDCSPCTTPQATAPKSLDLPPEVPPPTYHRRHRYYDDSGKFSAGLELGGGQFPGTSHISSIGGFGFLGDYNFTSQWALEGRLMFSNYSVNNPYLYNGGYYGYGYGYYYGGINYSQVDVTLGPNYRILKTPLSPVIGGMVGYSHRYFNSPYYSYYNNSQGTSDSAEVGPYLGLDYRVSKAFSFGADFRYMVPFASSNSGGVQYWPTPNQPVENLNYYIGGVYVKFSF